ncbi:MAG: DUF2130 domain-containing protein [Anaerorhabdus sp.]
MNEIKCPHCLKVFKVDESGYADLLKQVKNKEFNDEVHERLEREKIKFDSELKLLNAKAESDLKDMLNEKEKRINELNNTINNYQSEKLLELNNFENKMREKSNLQESKIKELEAKISENNLKKELEISTIKSKIDIEKNELKVELERKLKDEEIKRYSLENKYTNDIKQKDETIAFYKDLKAKQSTKMVGETLEQHCENEFNRIRMTAFKNAEFSKDNDARSGSKGDYIYREFSDDGIEIISIMFEMKNENEETATKKKNQHFFKELDKDRNEKKCEYAVLVSLLESDNDLYNEGIVDVSYEYPKMYVVRPQFFLTIISLLRNAALNSLEYKKESELMKRQNIDITNFEENLDTFKNAFAKNYDLASKKFKLAIDEIDKTITHLQKTKDALLSSENNLRLANNKADDITIKKLVKNNPTVKEMFEKL